MIELTMISTEKKKKKETGLTHDELWDAGFDLDDWDVCFASNVRLVEECTDDDGSEYYEPIDEAYWLVRQMEYYCVGYDEVEYSGKYYYTVHH